MKSKTLLELAEYLTAEAKKLAQSEQAFVEWKQLDFYTYVAEFRDVTISLWANEIPVSPNLVSATMHIVQHIDAEHSVHIDVIVGRSVMKETLLFEATGVLLNLAQLLRPLLAYE